MPGLEPAAVRALGCSACLMDPSAEAAQKVHIMSAMLTAPMM